MTSKKKKTCSHNHGSGTRGCFEGFDYPMTVKQAVQLLCKKFPTDSLRKGCFISYDELETLLGLDRSKCYDRRRLNYIVMVWRKKEFAASNGHIMMGSAGHHPHAPEKEGYIFFISDDRADYCAQRWQGVRKQTRTLLFMARTTPKAGLSKHHRIVLDQILSLPAELFSEDGAVWTAAARKFRGKRK